MVIDIVSGSFIPQEVQGQVEHMALWYRFCITVSMLYCILHFLALVNEVEHLLTAELLTFIGQFH